MGIVRVLFLLTIIKVGIYLDFTGFFIFQAYLSPWWVFSSSDGSVDFYTLIDCHVEVVFNVGCFFSFLLNFVGLVF
jgi:hypothetical protein